MTNVPYKTSKSSKLILIIGNDDEFNYAVKMRLEKNGYKTIDTLKTDLTNDKVKDIQPDLLLYDISHDDNDCTGDFIINTVFPNMENIKIIYFGTKQDTKYRWQALSDGSAGFIEKPYEPEELLSQISNAFLADL